MEFSSIRVNDSSVFVDSLWRSFACFFLCFFIFCVVSTGRRNNTKRKRQTTDDRRQTNKPINDGQTDEEPGGAMNARTPAPSNARYNVTEATEPISAPTLDLDSNLVTKPTECEETREGDRERESENGETEN